MSDPSGLPHSDLPPPRRVLLACADTSSRELIARTLRRGWFDVSCVPDGLAALDRLHRGDHDLAILDAALPGLSGPSLCRWVREHGPDRELPMLVWVHDAAQEAAATAAGATSTVGDPLRPRLLRHRTTTLLRPLDGLPSQRGSRLAGVLARFS